MLKLIHTLDQLSQWMLEILWGVCRKGLKKLKIYRELEFVGQKLLVDAKGQKLIS